MKLTPRRRKVAAAAAIAVSAALGLSACSAGSSSGQSSTDSPVTLTVWHYYNTDGQTATLQKLADSFTATHPNVTIDYEYVPVDQMTTKAVTAAGAGTGPDVIVFGASGTYDLAQAGAIEPMDWFDDFADSTQFADGAKQNVDGTLYGVQGFVNLLGLWYNKTLMTKLGIAAPPTTMKELEADMALAVAAGDTGITVTAKPGLESQWQGFPWLTSAGFSYDDPTAGSLSDTYTMLQDWIDKGYLSKEATTWDQSVAFQQFTAGSTLFASNGNWQITAAKEASFDYGVAPLPLSSDGGVLLGGEVENVGAFSEHKELAQEFLEQTFFSTQGELDLLAGFGAIPTRADASDASAISDDPILSVFAKIVAEQGRPSPSRAVPSKNVNAVETMMGDYWSKAVSESGTPGDLATQTLAELTPLLKG